MVGLDTAPTPGACFMVLVAFSGAWLVVEPLVCCCWPVVVVAGVVVEPLSVWLSNAS